MSEFLRGGAPAAAASPPATPPQPPSASGHAAPQGSRSNTVSLLAGVGVLLLALGVGVLIGRSGGGSKQGPVQVVTQAGGTAGSTAEAAFTADWPSGTTGYTVQLQALPVAGTTIAAVAAAKTAALGKGAGSVGALKSSEFTSLGGEEYVVYSGVYHKRAEAQKALAGLAKKFPGAKVIEVSNGSGSGGKEAGGGGSSKSSGGGSSKPSVPSSLSKPAPPAALPSHHASGKKFEEESAKLPDVVSTG